MTQEINGFVVDVIKRTIFKGSVLIQNGIIEAVRQLEEDVAVPEQFIMPGFIDAHIHIESSMMSPCAFATIAVQHGTVATVSDPHEIANVCGMDGIAYMINDGLKVPFKFYFGAPSCVPATPFETAGAIIDKDNIETLLQNPAVKYLSEMMNFPGVLHNDPLVMDKIAVAKKYSKPVDGHAPGLLGTDALQYIQAGISTDHECTSLEEAIWKAQNGMYILIREGSAAKNFDALIPLMNIMPNKVMFCSDDKHPDALMNCHINELVIKAIDLGYNIFDVLHASCVLPIKHYNLEVGLLQPGDPADCIIVKDLKHFEVLDSYINGVKVVENKKSIIPFMGTTSINHFNCDIISIDQIANSKAIVHNNLPIIVALDGQLITDKELVEVDFKNLNSIPNVEKDILKIIVVNRYKNNSIAVGFIKNFGFKKGAIASSVAHDCHNIVAVGVDDTSIVEAVNAIIENKGGISVYDGGATSIMSLSIAGLMSDQAANVVAAQYEILDAKAKALGCKLSAPFMTLSFMALPVIPHLKITDKGMFDVDKFTFI